MNNSIKSKLERAFLYGLVLGVGACGGHINLGEDQGASGSSGSGGSGGVASNNGNGGNPPLAGAGSGNVGAFGNVSGAATGGIGNLPSCAMVSDADTWIAFDSDRDDFDRELYLVHPDGSGLTRVTTRPGIDQEPAFSPDGNWLSFTSDRDGSLQIYLLELATGDVTQVTHHQGGADQSSFSHDGKLLAFHSGPSAFIIGIDGDDERLIASGPDSLNSYQHPQFTPDDARLVVDRNNEIDVFTLDGNEQRMIVQNWTTTIKAPSLSPSGLDVVYQVRCDTRTSLWTSPYSLNTNPCEGVRVTPPNELSSEHPSWGPGNQIVYARVDESTNTGRIALILRERGATPCTVTAPGADDRNPVWQSSAE